MKYKKILINCIRILFILGMIVFINRLFMPKYVEDNQDGCVTQEFYLQKTKLDVLAFGSSTVYNAISPDFLWKEYGFTSYTRANASQTLWQSYYLMEDALKTETPDLILVDMSFMKYGEEFVEEPSNRKAIDGMRLSTSKWNCIKASMGEEEPITYLFPIFRYHSRWKELTAKDLQYTFRMPEVTYDGYIMQFDIPEEQIIYEKEAKENYEFPQKAWEYLDKITELCKEKNVPLLLMKTPTYVNNWYDEYDEMLSQYASSKGIKYTNFDNYKVQMGNNLRLHYVDDGSHLNVVGAEVFSKFLGAYITEQYDIKNHSHDKKYQDIWDKKLERYEVNKAVGMKKYEEKRKSLGL
ncbi:MAG: SGNH/GDSL hydrolase family protein [Lachnospiraceae bacterium]|nr:SGNH/GDSL hydrolase family protein [Lachnospiraceae bacterium]